MSYFYICPTERVLDTAKSPNPGAVRPDRAQRAGWERQGNSIVTDGSPSSTTTCAHTQIYAGWTWVKYKPQRQRDRNRPTTILFLLYEALLHAGDLRQRLICWLQSSYSEIPPGAVWRRKRRGFSLRRHDGITSRCDWDVTKSNPGENTVLLASYLCGILWEWGYETYMGHEIMEKVSPLCQQIQGLLEFNLFQA